MKPAPSPKVLAADNQRLRQALAEATARAEGLATQAEALTAQAEALAAQIRELEAIRRDLEHQVALFKRCLFGSRSEKVSAEELVWPAAATFTGMAVEKCIALVGGSRRKWAG